ncbi:beta-1,3-galactosyltransferase 2-like isoform X1 [Portunus trituberculatus]|uniref:beta-1,3-galactosyltransferase 2-like isoform X1 n=1 Tax=Portunus trituberculatus TaxID=210409 RepID=UPI001E1CB9E2|nr:beta-1,3-galactosyltransferase 2-like isoform X1 [Portunus trituberculatus]
MYFSGRLIWVKIVVMCVTMVLMVSLGQHQFSRTVRVKKTVKDNKPHIPNQPNQIRIGAPPDVPRHFLIEEPDACTRQGDSLEVVVFVHSAIKRVEQRSLTRLTWANSSVINMSVVFMVGRAKSTEESNIVNHESELYHDIVQGDYGDQYRLLTYKALSALYWVNKHCAHVPWTLHADDDLLVDTHVLKSFIEEFDNSKDRNNLHCRLLKAQRVYRKGRWRVMRKEFPGRRYPPFCQGILWLLPTKEVSRLLRASAAVKFLWVDDAYITGLLAKQSGIKISGIPNERFGIAAFNESDVGNKLAWFHLRGMNLTQLWSGILEYYNTTTTPTLHH